jgi:hypothetical protein
MSGGSGVSGGSGSICRRQFVVWLWEAILRNLVVDEKQPQHVDPAIVEGRSIARLKLLQEVLVLDLRSPHFRNLSVSAERHTEWQRLCIVPERHYGLTHAAARELVTAAPHAAGLSWHRGKFLHRRRTFSTHRSAEFTSPFPVSPLGNSCLRSDGAVVSVTQGYPPVTTPLTERRTGGICRRVQGF